MLFNTSPDTSEAMQAERSTPVCSADVVWLISRNCSAQLEYFRSARASACTAKRLSSGVDWPARNDNAFWTLLARERPSEPSRKVWFLMSDSTWTASRVSLTYC